MRVPEGFALITPYVFVDGAESYVRFLERALGGREIGRTVAANGRIANCQVRFNGCTIMISESSEAFPASRAAFYFYVESARRSMDVAIQNGAEQIMEVNDMPYGDRQGGIRDPAGNIWWVSERLTEAAYF